MVQLVRSAAVFVLAGCASNPAARPDVPDVPAVTLDVPSVDVVAEGDRPDATDATDATDVAPDRAATTWRSRLYPPNWSPDDTASDGAFLHDFSYAGYHNGATPLATAVPTRRIDVVTAGADPTGARDATAVVQGVIAEVQRAGGGVVFFPEGRFRFDGVLTVSVSNVVLRGASSARSLLFFTGSVGLGYSGHIRVVGTPRSDLEVALLGDAPSRALSVDVAVSDAGTLAVGDDIDIGWVISPQFLADHGMTGTWRAFNDQWQPFFRRHVVAIERTASGQRVRLDVPLRFPARLRDRASVRRVRGLLSEVGVESLGLANAIGWNEAWAQNQIHVIEMIGVEDGWIRDVRSFVSPGAPASGVGAGAHVQSGGIMVSQSKRVTVTDVSIELAENRGGAGNGYLFEVRQSSEVLWRDLVGRAGRHNFIQNWGFGVTGCVWLRVHSSEGVAVLSSTVPFGLTGYSEFHHSLATANLIDSSRFDDGFSIVNRGSESTGAGHTGTENVLWNTRGRGHLRSFQYGRGYVIGTRDVTLEVRTLTPVVGDGTAPADSLEGEGMADTLDPPSLYLDQLRRRLGRSVTE